MKKTIKIVIEGPDRTGKKTQTGLLVKALQKIGKKVCLIEVPYNDRLTYPIIYWMLEKSLARKYPNVFQLIQFFNKLLFQIFVYPFLLITNDFIVFDRWALSAEVYGDLGGANKKLTRILNQFLIEPDLTFVFVGKSHIHHEKGEDEYEKDNEFQKNVHLLYSSISISRINHERINCLLPREKIHQQIMWYVKDYDFFGDAL